MCPWRTWRMPRTGYECDGTFCLTGRRKDKWSCLRKPIDLDCWEPTMDMVLLA